MTLLARLARMDASPIDDLLIGDDAEGGPPSGEPTPAAVLVAVVSRAEPTLLLTRRTDNLRHHAGQIAFPGGRAEPGEDAVRTALREAQEEIGLDAKSVRVLGTGDPYRTVTGFAVTPVVAIVPPDLRFIADPVEVAEIFEIPLAFATDRANHAIRFMDRQGQRRSYYEIAYGERRVWGATAAMIVNLTRRLERAMEAVA